MELQFPQLPRYHLPSSFFSLPAFTCQQCSTPHLKKAAQQHEQGNCDGKDPKGRIMLYDPLESKTWRVVSSSIGGPASTDSEE